MSSHSRDPIPLFIIYCTTMVGGGRIWLVPSLVLFTEEETEAASRTSQDNRLKLSPENWAWALPMDSPELRFKAQQKRFNFLSSRLQRPRGPCRQDTKPAGRGHFHQCATPYLLQPPPRASLTPLPDQLEKCSLKRDLFGVTRHVLSAFVPRVVF